MMTRILIIEDEVNLSNLIADHLREYAYTTIQAFTGTEGWDAFTREEPDLVLLDVMLPGMDGLTICRNIRAQSFAPIIMLTARSEEIDRVLGLELGADDYMPKPFSPRELVARVRAQLRRQEQLTQRASSHVISDTVNSTGTAIRLHDCTLNAELRAVTVAGRVVDLTRREFDLLHYLMDNTSRVLTREWLLERVWGDDFDGYDRTVDTHVLRLRDKLGRSSRIANAITAVRGIGYKLEV